MSTGVENAGNQTLIKQLADEMKAAKTKLPTKWKRDAVPNKCAPGTAVICDQFGNGVQRIEARLIMSAEAAAVCMPTEGEERGQTLCGGLLPQVQAGETLVLQFTPYPATREYDGLPCIYKPHTGEPGRAAYPNTGRGAALYEEFNGTWYYKNHVKAQEMMRAAKAEAAETKQPKGA